VIPAVATAATSPGSIARGVGLDPAVPADVVHRPTPNSSCWSVEFGAVVRPTVNSNRRIRTDVDPIRVTAVLLAVPVADGPLTVYPRAMGIYLLEQGCEEWGEVN